MDTGQEGNKTKTKNNLSDLTSSKDKALPSSSNPVAPAPSPAKPVTSTSTPAKKEPEPPAFEKELVTQLTSQF
jgi:hypothetical protein